MLNYILLNPDATLPHIIVLLALLGLLIEPYHRQIDKKIAGCLGRLTPHNGRL